MIVARLASIHTLAAVSDAQGSFRFDGIPLGTTYTVGLSTRSGQIARASIQELVPDDPPAMFVVESAE